MRLLYNLSIFFILIFVNLFGEITPEVSTLDNLIELTGQNLQSQERIRLQLIDYQKINTAFLKNPDDKEMLFQMIKSADRLFENINKTHLSQNFSPEFLNELKLFSQIASKAGIPKP